MTDFRTIADAIALMRAVPPVATVIADSTVTDPASGDAVDLPGRTVILPPLEDLPADLLTADGLGLRIDAAIGLLWGAVWQLLNAERHTAIGRYTLSSGVYTAGASVDFTVTWDAAPLATPPDGLVVVQPALAWQGRTTAKVKAGTTTTTGCTITMTVLASISPTSGSPITFEVNSPYDYFPEP